MPKGRRDPFLFQTHKGGIAAVCRSFAKTYGLEFDELLSEALVVFVKASKTYDGSVPPDKWVYVCLRRRLTRVAKAERVRARVAARGVDPDSLPGRETTRGVFEDMVARMSPPAAAVVSLALDRPPPLPALIAARGRATPMNVRLSIREHLRAAGWSVRDVVRTFNEIRKELRANG